MREAAKATGNRQLVWSGPRPPGLPVWSVPRDTHTCNSTHSCMTQRRAPEVHWAQCQLWTYIIPNVLCNYSQTQVGLVQPRFSLSFAAVPPRLLKEPLDRLQGFWCTQFRAKAGRHKVGSMQTITAFCIWSFFKCNHSFHRKSISIGFYPSLLDWSDDWVLIEYWGMASSSTDKTYRVLRKRHFLLSATALTEIKFGFLSLLGRCSKCPSPGRLPRPCYRMPFCRKAQRLTGSATWSWNFPSTRSSSLYLWVFLWCWSAWPSPVRSL